MTTIAIIATLAATVTLIATAIVYHVEAGDERRSKQLARLKSDHLRERPY